MQRSRCLAFCSNHHYVGVPSFPMLGRVGITNPKESLPLPSLEPPPRGCPILPWVWEGWDTTKASLPLLLPSFFHQAATAFKNNRKRQIETTPNPESELTPDTTQNRPPNLVKRDAQHPAPRGATTKARTRPASVASQPCQTQGRMGHPQSR